jgi:hypothetical protein
MKLTKELLRDMFSKDEDLVNKYHIEAGCGLDACVERTFNDLEQYNVETFLIKRDNRVVGYFGRENLGHLQCLTGFFIDPEYRTKEKMGSIWKEICSRFLVQFYVGLYDKNTRAIDFIKNNNGKEVLRHENKVLLLVDNRG